MPHQIISEMEQKEIVVYEALPLLREVLNVSGFTKMIGKADVWFNNKESRQEAFGKITPGFTEDNVELINYGLEKVVDACEKHRLQPPSECANRDIYNKYVGIQIKELRKLVSMVYIRENYTRIPESSWNKKVNNSPNRDTVAQFTESDIEQINYGIDKVAELLRSLKITL